MAQLHLSDEILMAFADGELEEPVANSVVQAMASDPTIAKRIAEFLRSRRLVRSVFPEETAADVSPELRTAVQAQIDRFEPSPREEGLRGYYTKLSIPFTGKRRLGMALAASVAGLALAIAAYLVRHQNPAPSQAAGPIAHLADPKIGRILSESRSGQEQELHFGRIRVISTFRVANGALCREFKLQAPSGALNAVACRDGNWRITFAVVEATAPGVYVPSDGASPIESYLQSAGAGDPLLGEEEIKALREMEP